MQKELSKKKQKLATEQRAELRVESKKKNIKVSTRKVLQSSPRQNGDSVMKAMVLVLVQEYTFLSPAHM